MNLFRHMEAERFHVADQRTAENKTCSTFTTLIRLHTGVDPYGVDEIVTVSKTLPKNRDYFSPTVRHSRSNT